MSGKIEALPSVETANPTENMEKVKSNDSAPRTEAPKDSTIAHNLTQIDSTNDNNNGGPIMATAHLPQNSVDTGPPVVPDTSEDHQPMEIDNGLLEQNEKPNDMNKSPDAPTTATEDQHMDTSQLEQGKKLNNIENPQDVLKTPSIPQKHAKDGVTDQSLPIDSRCQFRAEQSWIDLKFHSDNAPIKKPDELVAEMKDPPNDVDPKILNRIKGSMFGMALGDALGAHVEFRPRSYLKANPVTELESGGTWGLEKGQFTDDTSMALCLANSLVARHGFNPYDQLVRYKWWYEHGYMSSTGHCFDIGMATRQSVSEFTRRQGQFAQFHKIPFEQLDHLSDSRLIDEFNVFCSNDGVAGNGALMRLAPLPLFFYKYPKHAVEYSGISGQITHGDKKSYDSCRYYGALIVAAMQGASKEQLLDDEFYSKHIEWFNGKSLVPDVMTIAKGSYKRKGGYDDGIRGKGYIVNALEAALWAFWSDENSFEKGALAAVNLGDDTDTTAAIYGQLAGAYYGYNGLTPKWRDLVYAKDYITYLSKWIGFEAEKWVLCEEDKWNLEKLRNLNRDLNPDPPTPNSKPEEKPSPNTDPEEIQKLAPLSQESSVTSSTTENKTSNLEDDKIEKVSTTDADMKTKTTSFTSEPDHTTENSSPQPGESIVSSSTGDQQPVYLEDININMNPITEESMMMETTSSTSTPGCTPENKPEVPSTSVESNVCPQPASSSDFTDIMSVPQVPTTDTN